MNKLLNALGLMRVSEHERIVASLKREDWKGVAFGFEAKFKKAITDLAAARCEVEELKGRHVYEKLRADEWKAIAEGFRPDALAMRRKRERDRERKAEKKEGGK